MFVVIGARPVKAIETNDGGLAIYSFNWQTGNFELDMSYLNRLYGGQEDEFQELDENDFNAYVQKLKQERGIL